MHWGIWPHVKRRLLPANRVRNVLDSSGHGADKIVRVAEVLAMRLELISIHYVYIAVALTDDINIEINRHDSIAPDVYTPRNVDMQHRVPTDEPRGDPQPFGWNQHDRVAWVVVVTMHRSGHGRTRHHEQPPALLSRAEVERLSGAVWAPVELHRLP